VTLSLIVVPAPCFNHRFGVLHRFSVYSDTPISREDDLRIRIRYQRTDTWAPRRYATSRFKKRRPRVAASEPPVQYLVGTPKGRLTRLEQALLEWPWQAVRRGEGEAAGAG
jgi:hypothetical protein